MIQIGIAILGAILLRGPKYWDSEAQQSTLSSKERRRVVAEKFRSTFNHQPNAVGADSIAVARTSNLLRTDNALSMRKSSYGVKVFATCPYCSGVGCSKCASKGSVWAFSRTICLTIGCDIYASGFFTLVFKSALLFRWQSDCLRPVAMGDEIKVGAKFLTMRDRDVS